MANNINHNNDNSPFDGELLFDNTDYNIQHEKKLFVLVIYDISDNKRRYQMVKALKAFGFRVQMSAFEAVLNPNKYKKLVDTIKSIPSPSDSLRIYKLNGQASVENFGPDYKITDDDVIII